MEKLTAAQAQMLRSLVGFPRFHIASRPTVRALRKRGLAQTNDYGCTSITPAGLDAISGKGG